MHTAYATADYAYANAVCRARAARDAALATADDAAAYAAARAAYAAAAAAAKNTYIATLDAIDASY